MSLEQGMVGFGRVRAGTQPREARGPAGPSCQHHDGEDRNKPQHQAKKYADPDGDTPTGHEQSRRDHDDDQQDDGG